MSDIDRKQPRELVLRRSEQRTAELKYAIARLEVRKAELVHEIAGIEDTLAATKKSLEEHNASSVNI